MAAKGKAMLQIRLLLNKLVFNQSMSLLRKILQSLSVQILFRR